MANPNSAENKPLGRVICDYRKEQMDKRDKALSEKKAATSKMAGFAQVRAYKLCTLSETEATYDYYRDIDNYELFDAQQSAVVIRKNMEDYAKQDGDLTKLMTDDSKLLKDLKEKLAEANNEACVMRNKLLSIFRSDCGCPGEGTQPDEIQAISGAAQSLSKDSEKAAEAIVTIAGIHTFADLGALKPDGDKLLGSLKDTKKITDDYIKKAADDAKKAQTDLSKVIDELNTEEFKSFYATNRENGFNTVATFICDGKCEGIEVVETICEKVTGKNGEASPEQERGVFARNDRD